jgi:hypothetical protein
LHTALFGQDNGGCDLAIDGSQDGTNERGIDAMLVKDFSNRPGERRDYMPVGLAFFLQGGDATSATLSSLYSLGVRTVTI